MSARAEATPRGLVAGVLVLLLVVLGLGGAVVALKLRPQPLPDDAVQRAVVLWEQEVETHPGSADAHTGLGMALLDAGRSDEAQAEFETAISMSDDSFMAKFQLGLLLRDQDPQRAAQLLSAAAKKAPTDQRVAILIALGDTLLANGDAKDARDAYRRSIAYNPFTFDAHYGLGRALEELGDPKQALDEYQQAKRFDPTNEEVAQAIARLQG